MEKIDFKKAMKPYWQPPADRFTVVEVPRLSFLMIDGQGDPNGPAFAEATAWLYSVSYTLKFVSKADGRDYGVAPLEGLWWADDMTSFVAGDRAKWRWTAMIMQPDWITGPMLEAAIAKARTKLGTVPASLRLEPLEEGLSVQIMHVGPYDAEKPTIARLHAEYLPASGLEARGRHHEIYLGDPRRTAPEKLRTVIRQPVRRA